MLRDRRPKGQDRERADVNVSSCVGVTQAECDTRPECWVKLGEVRCPGYPKENWGRRA